MTSDILSEELGISNERVEELYITYTELYETMIDDPYISNYIKAVLADELTPEEQAFVLFNIGRCQAFKEEK